jgi:serine-threonine protein kinase 19
MNYHRTAAASSRVNKFGSRKKITPFSTAKRRKPSSSATTRLENAVDDGEDSEFAYHGDLEATETLRAQLAPGIRSVAIPDIMSYFQAVMFSEIPNRAPGMNSSRIAEILNYRLQIPPIVPLGHIYALKSTPTSTEREIVAQIQAGLLKKVTIPGRGLGSGAIGEGLVLVSEWEKLVQNLPDLSEELKRKYICYLGREPALPFTVDEVRALSRAGLLTASSSTAPTLSDTFLTPINLSQGTLAYVASAGSRHASGTAAAVATSSTEHLRGNTSNSTPHESPSQPHQQQITQILSSNLSLPNTGPYLRLVRAARTHLLNLLSKAGPHKSMPLARLRERWDGGSDEDVIANVEKPVKGVLPGRTKKWRELYGLRFEWALAESVGAGVLECFRTGSVGTGVRVI